MCPRGRGRTFGTNVERVGVDKIRRGKGDDEVGQEADRVAHAKGHGAELVTGKFAAGDDGDRPAANGEEALEDDTHGDHYFSGSHCARNRAPENPDYQHNGSLYSVCRHEEGAAADETIGEDAAYGADNRHASHDHGVGKCVGGAGDFEEIGRICGKEREACRSMEGEGCKGEQRARQLRPVEHEPEGAPFAQGHLLFGRHGILDGE